MFSNTYSDRAALSSPPPWTIPESLRSAFIMSGRTDVVPFYFVNVEQNKARNAQVWRRADINDLIRQAKSRTMIGTYGIPTTNDVLDLLLNHSDRINGRHMLVIGSERPWLE